MSKKVYTADVKVWATAYIVAESEEAAQELANDLSGSMVRLDRSQEEITVSEAWINTDLPEISFSPVCTIESASETAEWDG